MYHPRNQPLSQVQRAHDLRSLQAAVPNILDTLLVDINNNTRQEQGDPAPRNELNQVRGEQVDAQVHRLQRTINRLI